MKIDRKTLMRILREELSTHYSIDLKEETDASGMSKEMHDALEKETGLKRDDGEVEDTPTHSGGISLTEDYKRLTQLAGVRRTKNES